MDAFLSMPSWYRASEILQLAHLVVAHRPGWQAPTHGDIRDWLLRHSTLRSQDLHEKMAGCIYVHEVTQLEISSSAVRTLVKDGRDPVYLLPPRVRDILMKNRCYTK
jgi:nicotinate-nucleotide adenylyltransferase